MLVDIHKSDERGNVYTLREPGGITRLWPDDIYRINTVHVPEGFESDGASVPRLFWRVVFPPGDEKALRAAILHDYIYRAHPDGWTRADADAMFRDTLIEDGVPLVSANLAYAGVRLFGALAWRKGGKV